jgi:hypothetical protein
MIGEALFMGERNDYEKARLREAAREGIKE